MNAKQKKKLRLLLAVLAVAAALFLVLRHHNTASDAADETAVDTSAAAAGITALSYNNGTVTLRFVREGGSWYWTEDHAFPLEGDRVNEIAGLAGSLTPLSSIAPDQADALSAYGLESPMRYVSVTASDGTETTVYLGNQSADGTYYMTKSGDDGTVYVIASDLVDKTAAGINDMAILPLLPTVMETAVKQVHITAPGLDRTVTVSGGVWTEGAADVSARQEITDFKALLGSLGVTACVDYRPSADAYGLCGLGETAAKVTLTYTGSTGGEAQLSLTVGNARDTGGGYYALVNKESTIYLMSADQASVLLAMAGSWAG